MLLSLAGCGSDGEPVAEPTAPRTITVTSPAFAEGERIPAAYTCRGAGTPPPLAWSGVDRHRAGSLALVVDDPDAPGGDYLHWIVVGIPVGPGALHAGVLPAGAQEVPASAGPGWSPPCPPSGTHHYRFTLYALPAGGTSALRGRRSPAAVVAGLAERAVGWGRLTGTVSAR